MSALTLTEVQQLRDGTPGCRSGIIHFNHAGASLPSQATLDAIIDQLQREARDGPMEAGEQGAILAENARRAAAQLLNAPTSSIAFASSGSTAWSMAFQALGPWQPGDRILVGRHEWGGNLASMQTAVQAGAQVEVIPCDETGAVSLAGLESMIDKKVRLIDLNWLPANSGLINPAQAIGQLANWPSVTPSHTSSTPDKPSASCRWMCKRWGAMCLKAPDANIYAGREAQPCCMCARAFSSTSTPPNAMYFLRPGALMVSTCATTPGALKPAKCHSPCWQDWVMRCRKSIVWGLNEYVRGSSY